LLLQNILVNSENLRIVKSSRSSLVGRRQTRSSQTRYLGCDGHAIGEVLFSPPGVTFPDTTEKDEDPTRAGGMRPPICVCSAFTINSRRWLYRGLCFEFFREFLCRGNRKWGVELWVWHTASVGMCHRPHVQVKYKGELNSIYCIPLPLTCFTLIGCTKSNLFYFSKARAEFDLFRFH
jgi:hypothetical protein